MTPAHQASTPLSSLQKDRVLIVDDEPLLADLMSEIVQEIGCEALIAHSIDEARKLIGQNDSFSLLICDQRLPDGIGLEFIHEVKVRHPQVTRLLITGFPQLDVALSAINSGEIFRFLTKPLTRKEAESAIKEALEKSRLLREKQRLQEALLESNEQLRKANRSLQKALTGSIKFCLGILETYDHVLATHSLRVSKMAVSLGRSLGLSEADLECLEIAAQMHDIGLVSVSRSFCHEQQQIGWETLPPLQQAALHDHPKTGSKLAHFLPHREAPSIIQAHHEWFNGGGYPSQLRGESIPYLASILSVCDSYDEIPMERKSAFAFIEENLGKRFHPEIGRAFLRMISDRPCPANSNECEVLIAELTPGMILTCDVYSANGVLLIPKEKTLTPHLIRFLQDQDQTDPLTQRIFVTK